MFQLDEPPAPPAVPDVAAMAAAIATDRAAWLVMLAAAERQGRLDLGYAALDLAFETAILRIQTALR